MVRHSFPREVICCIVLALTSAAAAQSETLPHFLLSSGADIWRNGGSAYLSAQWSPEGVDRNGFTLKLLLAEGGYLYRAGAADIRGTHLTAAILPGWKFTRGAASLTLYAGLDAQQHWLSPDDPGNTLRGTHVGARAGADIWWEPTQQTMVAASLTGSTIGGSGSARLAAGWRMGTWGWLGPEAQLFADAVYRQYRAGGHLTGLKTGSIEWSLGSGFVTDSENRSGVYARLGLLTRR